MELNTDNSDVAALVIAWQMTTNALSGITLTTSRQNPEEQAKKLREIFTGNYKAIRQAMKEMDDNSVA